MESVADVTGSIFSSWFIGLLLLFIFCYTPSLIIRNGLAGVDLLINNFIRNFSLFSIVTYSLAKLDLPINLILKWELVIIFLIYLILTIKGKIGQLWIKQVNLLKILIASSIIGTFIYLPPLVKTGLNGSIFGLSTVGNNDVAFYSLTASEFLKSGFTNAENIMNLDLNTSSKLQHQTANLLISFTSEILNLQTWQVLNGIMVFCISIAIISIAFLAKAFNQSMPNWKYLLTGFIVISSPIITYLVGNFFLGQVMSIPIASSTLGYFIFLGLNKSPSGRINKLALSFLFILSSMVYPVLLIPIYVAGIVIYIFLQFTNGESRGRSQDFAVFCYILLGVFISLPYLPTAFHLIFLLNEIEAGWPLKSLNPVSLFVFGKLLDYPFEFGVTLILWISWLTLLYFIVKTNDESGKGEKLLKFAFIFGIPAIYIFAVEIRDGDYTQYHNWKLLTYFIPILYTIFTIEVLNKRRTISRFIFIPFLLSLLAPTLQWLPNIHDKSGVLTRDMSNLYKNQSIQKTKSLNIKLRPYFESMLAADIVDNNKVYINSKTTMPSSIDKQACSLVDLRDNQYAAVQKINRTYGLIASELEGCKIQNATNNFFKISIGENVAFNINSEGSSALIENWSSAESWGIWSIEKKARVKFKLKDWRREDYYLEIKGSAFINTKRESTKVKFESPLFETVILRFLKESTSGVIRIRIQSDALEKLNGNIEFEILTPDAISPKELGQSDDSRTLGFGLLSIRVIPVKNID
jgi:hypothetical protein